MANNNHSVPSVSERVVKLVEDYLVVQNIHGVVHESLEQIGRKLNISHSSVRRGLKKLEARGVVEIEKSTAPTIANKIYYIGKPERLAGVEQNKSLKVDIIYGLRLELMECQQKAALWDNFRESILSIDERPGGKIFLVIAPPEQLLNWLRVDSGKTIIK